MLYHSLEAAQRAADGVLINDHPHDCRQVGCGEWMPFQGVGPASPERPM